MEKTNFEKLKELKEYEMALVINMLPMHVAEVQAAKGIPSLDEAALEEDEIEIITSWLKDSYDEQKGFKLYLSGGIKYITQVNLNRYDYLEETHVDYSEHFESDDEEEE